MSEQLQLRSGKQLIKVIAEISSSEEEEESLPKTTTSDNSDDFSNSINSNKEEGNTIPEDNTQQNTNSLSNNKGNLFRFNMSKLNIETALKIIPNFDGTPSQLHKFLTCCEIINKPLTERTDIELFLEILKSKLSGKAYEVTKYHSFKTFDEFKNEFLKQFLETRTLEQIQMELVKIRQGHQEEDLDYANRVEKLLMDLDESSTTSYGTNQAEAIKAIRELNSRTALKAFQEGLREPLKLFIKACRFSNLQEAIKTTINEGKQNPIRKHYNSFPKHPQNSQGHTHGSPISCNYCKKTGHSYAECRSKLKCGSCQRIGHNTAQCRVNPKSNDIQNSNRSSPANNRVNQTRISCAYCKIPGHHISDCYKKKRSDERTTSTNPTSTSENSTGQASRDQTSAQQLK